MWVVPPAEANPEGGRDGGPAELDAAVSVVVRSHPGFEFAAILDRAVAEQPEQGYLQGEDEYLRAGIARLRRFSNHPGALLHKEVLAGGLDEVARTFLFVRLAGPPSFGERLSLPAYFVALAGGRSKMRRWLAGLASLYADSRFADFHAEQAAVHRGFARELEAGFLRDDPFGALARYTGLALAGTYYVQPSPFLRPGPQANSAVELPDGSYEITTTLGPENFADGAFLFYSRALDERVWHEVGHGLLDTLTDLYDREVAALTPLAAGHKNGTREQWRQWVKEHAVRTVRLRLIARERGAEALALYRRRDIEEDGFRYTDDFLAALEEYEARRGEFPSLAEFFPRLLDRLRRRLPESSPRPAQKDGTDAGPEAWIWATAPPFHTAGQRARGQRYLERMLARAPDPGLLLKRAKLRAIDGKLAEAAADAALAAALDPARPESALVLGLLRERMGEDALAGEAYRRARDACGSSGAPDPEACAALRARLAAVGN